MTAQPTPSVPDLADSPFGLHSVCRTLSDADATLERFAWLGDRLAAAVWVRETRESVAIGIVYTPATFRGQGYGTAALRALSRLLDERGVKNRYLWIDPKSDAAQALAASLGCRFVFDSLDIDCE